MSMIRGSCVVWLALLAAPACDKGKKNEGAPTAAAQAQAPAPTPAAPAPTGPAVAAPAVTPPPATTPAATAPAGTSFGAGVKLADATPIATILADPKAFHGKTVRVEGMITDVCPKRGCWFELAGTAPGQKLRFKVTDGEMVFPPDAKGKRAIAEGVVAVRDLSLEETKQYLEYQAKEYGQKYDPASVTKPTSVVRLDGTGAVFQ